MATATFIKKLNDGWLGDARLYRLSDPPFYAGRRKRGYVVVSGVDLCSHAGLPYQLTTHIPRQETFIFQATRLGKLVKGFEEMEGSFKGSINHALAIKLAGWALVDTA